MSSVTLTTYRYCKRYSYGCMRVSTMELIMHQIMFSKICQLVPDSKMESSLYLRIYKLIITYPHVHTRTHVLVRVVRLRRNKSNLTPRKATFC